MLGGPAAQSQKDLGKEPFDHTSFICCCLLHDWVKATIGREDALIHCFPTGMQGDRLMILLQLGLSLPDPFLMLC